MRRQVVGKPAQAGFGKQLVSGPRVCQTTERTRIPSRTRQWYRDADKSLAPSTSRYILFDD